MNKNIKLMNGNQLLEESISKHIGRMSVQGNISVSQEDTLITSWYDGVQIGTDIVPKVSQGYFEIKNTKVLRTSGVVCGRYNANCYIRVFEKDTENIPDDNWYQRTGILINSSGNDYWKVALPECLIQLESSKTYLVKFYFQGYNSDANLNLGFGSNTTIQCEKVL